VGLTLAMAIGALLLTVLVAVESTRPWVQDVDDAWLELVDAARVAPLTWLARSLSVAGSVVVMLPLRIGVASWLAFRHRWAQLTAFLLAMATSEISIGSLKALIERPRPSASLIETHGFAFPSGHAIAASVTAAALVMVLLPEGPDRRRWEVRAILFALVMALSRTYLRAHWLSDVVAGTLIGAALALGSVALVLTVRRRWRAAQARRLPPAPPPASPTADATPRT
jgi:membrane-associated phospholipid phosphatase